MDRLEEALHGTTQTLGGQSLAAALVQDGNAVTGGGRFRYFLLVQIINIYMLLSSMGLLSQGQ